MFHHQQHQNHLLTKTTKKKKVWENHSTQKNIQKDKNKKCVYATLSFIPILKKKSNYASSE